MYAEVSRTSWIRYPGEGDKTLTEGKLPPDRGVGMCEAIIDQIKQLGAVEGRADIDRDVKRRILGLDEQMKVRPEGAAIERAASDSPLQNPVFLDRHRVS